MMRRLLPILAGCVFLYTGCAPGKPWERAGAERIELADAGPLDGGHTADHAPSNRWTGQVTAYAVMRPELPNALLQLPRVSPDSRWIAYLDRAGDGPPISSDALITGRGLRGFSLWLRSIESDDDAKAVAYSGACWPVWSPDSRQLCFVTYDEDQRASLGVYDTGAGTIAKHAVGLRHMLMPAAGPTGLVAVSAYGEVPDRALIFIVDLDSGQALPGPPGEHGAQIYPRWISSRTLVYIELAGDVAHLRSWEMGSDKPNTLATLPAPASIFDAQHLLAGINDPLRHDLGAYAFYNPSLDRVELVDYATITARALPAGFRGGAWWGDDWFIAGADDRVELASSRRTDGDTGSPRMIGLLTGRWLPIWADRSRQAALLLGESDTPGRFKLMQLWLTAGDD